MLGCKFTKCDQGCSILLYVETPGGTVCSMLGPTVFLWQICNCAFYDISFLITGQTILQICDWPFFLSNLANKIKVLWGEIFFVFDQPESKLISVEHVWS